jgi:hypothetical protein
MDEDIKKLLEKNLKLAEKLQKDIKYIKRYVITSQILGVLKILIIVVPIVLGIIYLPPLIREMMEPYKQLFGGNPMEMLIEGDTGNLNLDNINPDSLNLDNIDLDQLPPEVRKFLK